MYEVHLDAFIILPILAVVAPNEYGWCHFDAAFASKHTQTQTHSQSYITLLYSCFLPVLRHPISNTFADIMAHVGINAAIMIYIFFGWTNIILCARFFSSSFLLFDDICKSVRIREYAAAAAAAAVTRRLVFFQNRIDNN